MKKIFAFVAVLSSMLFFCGCTTGAPCGWISTDVTIPIAANRVEYNVETSASCNKYFGLFCYGDASVSAAINAYNKGKAPKYQIKHISSVDMRVSEVLGFATYTVIVRGLTYDPKNDK